MLADDHRRRASAAALLLSAGAVAVLGSTTGHAVLGWFAAVPTATIAGVLVSSRRGHD